MTKTLGRRKHRTRKTRNNRRIRNTKRTSEGENYGHIATKLARIKEKKSKEKTIEVAAEQERERLESRCGEASSNRTK
jgi:hypothetical protein